MVGRGDFVIDLGSGDGRNVIGAARRGARALGVEYNPDMVELSRRKAAEAGVADRARFERGDMFAADISRASVMALFLLPSNLLQLRPKFLALAPGSRIVSNTFLIADWAPDASDVASARRARCGARRTCRSCRRRPAARWRSCGRRADAHPDLPEAHRHADDGPDVATPVTGTLRGEEIELSGGAAAVDVDASATAPWNFGDSDGRRTRATRARRMTRLDIPAHTDRRRQRP